MAKTRAHKTRKSSNSKRNLFIVAVVLLSVGLLMFFMESKKSADIAKAPTEEVVNKNGADIGPDRGCDSVDTNYVCNIKIKNPSEQALDWSVLIDGLEGATVSEEQGTLASSDERMIQLIIPQDFCVNNPESQGNVTVVDDTMVGNQAKTTFNCAFREE